MCIDIFKYLGIDLTDKDNHFSNILLKLNKSQKSNFYQRNILMIIDYYMKLQIKMKIAY